MKYILLFFLFVTCLDAKNINVELGIPTNTQQSDYLIYRTVLSDTVYVVGYNTSLNVPNWVSWNLNSNWYGDAERWSGNFVKDASLPNGITQIVHSDYTNSGFDRGHLCPSEERTSTPEQNKSTFILTNILPQYHELNGGAWYGLEYYCKSLCYDENKELYIVAGGVFKTGNKINDLIGIPDSTYKIIIILDRNKTLKDVDVNTNVIAVMMPNTKEIGKSKWYEFVTTIDNIEATTGYNFLSEVPKQIQDVLESKQSITSIPDLKKNVENSVSVYPNPASERLHLKTNKNSIESFKVSIFNILGFNIAEYYIIPGMNDFSIDVSNFSTGIYLLKMDNDVITFIKE